MQVSKTSTERQSRMACSVTRSSRALGGGHWRLMIGMTLLNESAEAVRKGGSAIADHGRAWRSAPAEPSGWINPGRPTTVDAM